MNRQFSQKYEYFQELYAKAAVLIRIPQKPENTPINSLKDRKYVMWEHGIEIDFNIKYIIT